MTAAQAVERYLSARYGFRPRPAWRQLIQTAAAECDAANLTSTGEVEEWLFSHPTALASLVGRLVVSESFFFRHEEQLTILVKEMAFLLKDTPHQTRILWSAGCARGEEIYSLAMALVDAFGPDITARAQLIGTDVSAAAIAQAETGRFSAWSWRREPRRHGHIRFQGGGDFTVSEWLREWVRFDVGLVRERADTLPADAVDAILFRNVAIYLTEPALAATYRSLFRVLRPGGLLFVAPTDPAPSDFVALEHCDPTIPVYRKPSGPGHALSAPSAPPACTETAGEGPSVPVLHGGAAPADGEPNPSLRRAMECLAQRDYDSAAALLCRTALLFPNHALLRYWAAYALYRGGCLRRATLQLGALTNLLSTRDERELLEDAETTVAELSMAADRLRSEAP